MIAAAVSVQMKNGVFIVEGGFEYALESLPHSLSMPREHDYQRPVGPKAGHPGTHSQAEVQETAARRTHLSTQQSHSGSIYGVGGRFQSFRINDLELVDLTGIEPVTS